MLPYTPLHHLLMQEMQCPIVLTSGNRSDEPQCVDNEEARERLKGIAETWLLHDRDIVNRLDDSVQRMMDGQPRMLRRARGYAPAPIPLPLGFERAPDTLAFGGELKNTFCLTQDGKAIVSQHMGDLEDLSTHQDYRHNLTLYRQLFDHHPVLLAVDRHPGYLSTQWGHQTSVNERLPIEEVQHHHAHIAACMAEYGLPLNAKPVLGIALDGLGYGSDGQIWGGEFLKVSYTSSDKLAGFKPIAMIGGSKAIYEPWRNSYAHLMDAFGWETLVQDYADLDIVKFFRAKPHENISTMLDKGINCPKASSAGRLFDAVAAVLGICRERASHEGQAAIELEALIDRTSLSGQKGYACRQYQADDEVVLSWEPLWRQLLDDIRSEVSIPVISARFHVGVASAVSGLAIQLCEDHQLETVVLSGGVFQNRVLLELTSDNIRRYGLKLLSPSQLPVNDGGISFGQAIVAAARYLKKHA